MDVIAPRLTDRHYLVAANSAGAFVDESLGTNVSLHGNF
jgi:hypothetical protein